MTYDWGPHYIMPTTIIERYSGMVELREVFDENLLQKELKALGLPTNIDRISNPWYYRRKNTNTWVLIGESDDKSNNFAVAWDTRKLDNGQYEVMGLMHAFVIEGGTPKAIAGQNIVEVTVENSN